MRARPLLTAASGALLLTGLTACQQPTPGITVSSGRHAVHVESTTFCRDGQSAERQDCVEHLRRFAEVRVKQGDPVAFDVDKTLAEHGWILVLPAANQRSDVLDSHHFAYTPDFGSGPILDLEVRSLDHVADDARQTGVWKVRLVAE